MNNKLKDNFFKYYNPSIRILVGLVFFISGILKIIDISVFKSTLTALNLFNPIISDLFSFVIPIAEIGLGLLLIGGLFIRFAVIHTNILIIIFSWVTIYAIRYKEDLSCGCFGSFIDLSFNFFHLVFLFMLFLLNILIVINIIKIWSLGNIINEKFKSHGKIRIWKILIYVLIGIVIIISLLFYTSISLKSLEREAVSKISEESDDKVALETQASKVKIMTGEEISEVVQISVDAAFEAFKSSKYYIFLDVRDLEEYQESHIKGAKNIPLIQLEDRLNELPKDIPIIVYCSGTGCDRGLWAAVILVGNGFREIYDMGGGGIVEWEEKRYPVEIGN